MKLLPLKCLTLITILLVTFEISKGQVSSGNKEAGEITNNLISENGPTEKNCQNLELKENESRPTNHGEKCETIVLACPVSKNSEVRIVNVYTLQQLALIKKSYSLISHCYLLISKTLHLSPLVNILRI